MEAYMTLKQLAEKLNLNVRTLYRLQRKPGFPRLKIGRAVRYKPSDVIKWISDNQNKEMGFDAEKNDNK